MNPFPTTNNNSTAYEAANARRAGLDHPSDNTRSANNNNPFTKDNNNNDNNINNNDFGIDSNNHKTSLDDVDSGLLGDSMHPPNDLPPAHQTLMQEHSQTAYSPRPEKGLNDPPMSIGAATMDASHTHTPGLDAQERGQPGAVDNGINRRNHPTLTHHEHPEQYLPTANNINNSTARTSNLNKNSTVSPTVPAPPPPTEASSGLSLPGNFPNTAPTATRTSAVAAPTPAVKNIHDREPYNNKVNDTSYVSKPISTTSVDSDTDVNKDTNNTAKHTLAGTTAAADINKNKNKVTNTTNNNNTNTLNNNAVTNPTANVKATDKTTSNKVHPVARGTDNVNMSKKAAAHRQKENTFHGVALGGDSGSAIPQQLKEVDQFQKFKMFEFVQALVQGRLPTNKQLDQFLDYTQKSKAVESRKHLFSNDGMALYKTYQELMETARKAIVEKNEQEVFQNFLYHCMSATDSVKEAVDQPGMEIGITKDEAKTEAKKTLDELVLVAKLITTNAEFRNILNELFDLLREILLDGTDKLIEGVQVGTEKLTNQTESWSGRGNAFAQDGPRNLTDQINDASLSVQERLMRAKEDPINTGYDTHRDLQYQYEDATEAARKATADIKQTMNEQAVRAKASAKQTANQMGKDATRYANNKMPAERREAYIERFKLILAQIQSDPQYQVALDSMLELGGEWRKRAQKPAGNVATEANKIVTDSNVESATREFKTIMQRWAQGYPLDPLIDRIQAMWQHTWEDPDLAKYVDQCSKLMNRAAREPAFVASPVLNRETNELIDYGRDILMTKYRPEMEEILNEGKKYFYKLANDPMSKEVSEKFKQFAQHLCYNDKGELVLKPHLFDDFRFVILPSLCEAFQFIPVPKIQYTDNKLDLMLDNMILTSTDFLPRAFEAHMSNTVHLNPRESVMKPKKGKSSLPGSEGSADNRHEFRLVLKGVEANVHDLKYYVKTKTGMKFTDRGVADVLVNGKGMDIMIFGHKSSTRDGTPSLIHYEKIKVKINTLNIKVKKSEHSLLHSLATPFIKGYVKKAIAKSLESRLSDLLESTDRFLATAARDSRIKTGKGTFGAIFESTTNLFVPTKKDTDHVVTSPTASDAADHQVAVDEQRLEENVTHKKKKFDSLRRNSKINFDAQGMTIKNPSKQMELKVGEALVEKDRNAMNSNGMDRPWASSAFDLNPEQMPTATGNHHVVGGAATNQPTSNRRAEAVAM